MSLFDNMLDLNNSFLLIALIIIAVICIYLLYSNLTKSGETASLKSGINALIQQNKKRDEIINFLLERVENLEHNVTPAQILPVEQTPVTHSIPVIADDIDAVLSSVEQPVINTASASEVEDILESITNTVCTGIESSAQCNATASTSFSGPPGLGLKLNVGGTENSTASTVEDVYEHHNAVVTEDVHDTHTEQQLEATTNNSVTEPISEFPELESEFEGLLTISDVVEPEVAPSSEPEVAPSSEPEVAPSSDPEVAPSSDPEVAPSSDPEVAPSSDPEVAPSSDLVSALLDADEESLAGDHEFDLSTVPKGKDKLNAQYTVKQLKSLSRQLKLKSKGNKTELINRIHEKLN